MPLYASFQRQQLNRGYSFADGHLCMYQTGKSQEAEVGTIPKLNLPLTLSSRFFFIKIGLYICYPFLFRNAS